MRKSLAMFLAVFAAAGAAASVVLLFLFLASPSWMVGGSDVLLALGFAFSVCFGYSMLAGIPIALALKHTGRFRLAPMTVAGAAAGALPGLLLYAWEWFASGLLNDWATAALLIALGGVAGAAGGASFFLNNRFIDPGPHQP